jgi:aconitate hydratase
MQDTAGVAALADLAALRDAVVARGGPAAAVHPAVPIDLIIDHSVNVDVSSVPDALSQNMKLEFARNRERYEFFRWAQQAFKELRIVPPGNGICHQINLEHLAKIAAPVRGRPGLIAGESVIGTDSHTTMVNALGVLGWGVGGIEAEAVALDEPLMVQVPAVTLVTLTGRRAKGVTATDIALAVTRRLRDHGVVGHFVEFSGGGLDGLTLSDRAAIANMAPEYGATCGFFPIDQHTLDYLRATGRSERHTAIVEAYARAVGLWRNDNEARRYSSASEIDLSDIGPLMAGPKRPQDEVRLADVPASLRKAYPGLPAHKEADVCGQGAVVIAAITSCTNTANPHLMIAAGLLARNARRFGLVAKPWVKMSLSPGSRAIANLLSHSGLQADLDALGFNIVGFGCTTCVGNSGDLKPDAMMNIRQNDLVVCAVLSGNRNFESRIHPDVKANYLASPPLVVAYALAGNLLLDLAHEPIGFDPDGRPVMLTEIWPSDSEVDAFYRQSAVSASYRHHYRSESLNGQEWISIIPPSGTCFPWDDKSTFVRRPPFFDDPVRGRLEDIEDARPLLVLGDSVTTDHISPIGRILPQTLAASYLSALKVDRANWGSYGERRANHEVMWRGTFAHPRLENALAGGRIGPFTMVEGSDDVLPIFDAARVYAEQDRPILIFAGREYGTGSARDWAAKGTKLLGVRAVIAESFERIHRANLIGVGVLPLEISEGVRVGGFRLNPATRVSISGLSGVARPKSVVQLHLLQPDGEHQIVPLICRLDTLAEISSIREGGIFGYAERLKPV